VDAWMVGEPGRDHSMGVGAVVVEHHVQLPPRGGPGHELEEGEGLAVAVPREALVGHLAGGDLQRCEQGGGPVPHIIVGAPLGAARAERQVRGGASKRLDLALSSTQTTMARSGGSRDRPTTSRTLASSWGSVET